ncbi:rCG37627 [Rattus norvegicus]|uniref:RCG37627 n=1 Tax=Rattus norvegicus TaxID=10116 RepID=A6K814_RAT|nr:rCG37627 [Rattus norvegicus]
MAKKIMAEETLVPMNANPIQMETGECENSTEVKKLLEQVVRINPWQSHHHKHYKVVCE